MKVTLFATCLVDMFRSNVGKATVELLEHLGCEIDFPESQICCGQPAYNSGYIEETKPAMKKMITAFEHAEYVVSPSGSCAYFFKEYPHIFKGDPVWEPKAQALADELKANVPDKESPEYDAAFKAFIKSFVEGITTNEELWNDIKNSMISTLKNA